MNEEPEVIEAGPLVLTRGSWSYKMVRNIRFLNVNVTFRISFQIDILLRLPPVYMMDSLLGQNMGVLTEPVLQSAILEEELNITQQISQSTDLYHTFSLLYGGSPALLLVPHLVRFLLSCVLYLLAISVFLLPTTSILVFYRQIGPLDLRGPKYVAEPALLCHGDTAEGVITPTGVISCLSLCLYGIRLASIYARKGSV